MVNNKYFRGAGFMLRKILIVASSLLLFILFASGAYVYTLLDQISHASHVDGSPQSPDSTNSDNSNQINDPPDREIALDTIENILILGLDRLSSGEPARSDTVMIATVDKKNDTLKLTSILRDMYVSIPGYRDNKVNAAFALGGHDLAIATINENFGLNVEKFVVLDFLAFEDIIDIIGGISIEVSEAEARAINRNLDKRAKMDGSDLSEYYVDEAGSLNLNGKQALAYARIRDVGRDDHDRVERQQIVLSTLFDKALKLNPLKFPSLVTSVLSHAQTNLTAFEILNLGTTALLFENKEIHRFRLPVAGTYSPQTIRGGASALVADLPENKRLLNSFLQSDPNVE